MAKQKRLSLCVIMDDDERPLLSEHLADLEGLGDETLVIDLGTDHAGEPDRQAGAVVYRLKWEEDLSKIQNFCMEHAAGDWVLFLQADETIPPGQRDQLETLMQNPTAEGYLLDSDEGGEAVVSSPVQRIRLIRNRKNYRFKYRAFPYIPEEELFALQSTEIGITHRGDTVSARREEERSRLLQKDLAEYPYEGYLWYLQGIEFLNQGKCKESAASLEMARHAFTGGYLYVPHLYKCLGACLLNLGRDSSAEEVLNEGIWLFPNYTDLLILRAELYSHTERDEMAMKDLETCQAFGKTPVVSVPKPGISLSAAGEMLTNIRARMNGQG